MTRNAIVDALGVLKAGRIVDPTHLVHPGIQRFGPFRAMRIEPRYTVAESGFHVDAPEHFVEGRRTLERIELEELMLPLFVLHFEERGVTAVGHETLDTDGSADVRARGSSTERSTCSSPITIRSRSWRTSTSCPRRAA